MPISCYCLYPVLGVGDDAVGLDALDERPGQRPAQVRVAAAEVLKVAAAKRGAGDVEA